MSYYFAGAAVVANNMGLGRDIWTLTPDQVNNLLRVFFAFEIVYSFLVFFIKISIIFLYMRIFPGRTFQKVLWATQVLLIASLTAFSVADGFQCRPVQYFWTFWDGRKTGTCFNINAFSFVHAGYNLGLEFWMLALPASQVWNLNMSLKKRIQVLSMFGFGILYVDLLPFPLPAVVVQFPTNAGHSATIISIIRLPSLKLFTQTTNPSSTYCSLSTVMFLPPTAEQHTDRNPLR